MQERKEPETVCTVRIRGAELEAAMALRKAREETFGKPISLSAVVREALLALSRGEERKQ